MNVETKPKTRGTRRAPASHLVLLGALAALTSGCIDIKEHLTIRPDGSGKVTIDVKCDIDPDVASMMRTQGRGMPDHLAYPPTCEEDARKLFPGDDFQVKVEKKPGTRGKVDLVIEVGFGDINTLLSSPYGRAHSLSLTKEGDELRFAARSGLRGTLALAGAEGPGMGMPPAFTKLQSKKDEMRAEFKVTMPGRVRGSNGNTDGATATWAVDRAGMASDEEATEALGRRMEAACSAARTTLRPVTPVRLALASFAELVEGETGEKAEGVDRDEVAAAVSFVPYRLKVTRYFDLTGEGHGGWDQGAELTGAIVVPKRLAPQKWGEVEVEEVTDEEGNDLTFGEERGHRTSWSTMSGGMPFGRDPDPTADPNVRRVVSLRFKSPDRNVRTIEKIRASVDMTYFAGSRVVKLAEAVAADRIVDMAKAMRGGGFGGSDSGIKDPKLQELGIELDLSQAMEANGLLMLTFQVEEKNTSLSEVQVFDAEGRPWQTLSSDPGMGGSGMRQVLVLGTPEPPLSLALVVRGGGASVMAPIELERVPVRGGE
jgi:hypothetical protein